MALVKISVTNTQDFDYGYGGHLFTAGETSEVEVDDFEVDYLSSSPYLDVEKSESPEEGEQDSGASDDQNLQTPQQPDPVGESQESPDNPDNPEGVQTVEETTDPDPDLAASDPNEQPG